MGKKVILYTLQTFSSTGGIQKMTRTLSYCLYQLSQQKKWEVRLWSAYDHDRDLLPQYLPATNFKGFSKNRAALVLKTIFKARWPDVIIISHVNMAIIGLIIKTLNPKCKVWLIAHGIEVWRPLSGLKRRFLKKCDKIVCVSQFTKGQMISRHNTDPNACVVLNNAVDPFMRLPTDFTKPADLLKRYRLKESQPIVFTLTRLASTEQYKGHDQVIKAIPVLRKSFPGIKYVLAGEYDHKEEIRIQKLINENKVDEEVILTGFVNESELTDYFLLADVFVLPSKKEGFGIVFIEALACGLPVICGNADGSIDAICNGELGTAVDADNVAEIATAIEESLKSHLTKNKREHLQQQCLQHFNEKDYINKLEKLICDD